MAAERTFTDVSGHSYQSQSLCLTTYCVKDSWYQVVRTAWRVNPAVAVHMAERFKAPAVTLEVGKLVRASPAEVSHVPEALRFFLGADLDLQEKAESANLPRLLDGVRYRACTCIWSIRATIGVGGTSWSHVSCNAGREKES